MDPVTHALVGGLVARAGIARRVLPAELERRGVLWTAAFALAPDLDAVAELSSDPLAFLRHHRGLTHSVAGGGALALVLALLFARLFPGVKKTRVLVLTALGVYLHVFLDLLTSYGTVLLYPFDNARFTLDWLWTVDPTFTGILLGGLLALYFLRREPRRVAKGCVGLALGYICLCGVLQWHARQAVAAEAHASGIPGIQQVSAVPAPFVPLRWTGVVETEDTYYRADVDLAEGLEADIRFVPVRKGAPADGSNALRAVSRAPLREQVQLYEWFARFPVVSIERDATGEVVRFYDLRFDLPGLDAGLQPYVFTVRLNADGEVIETRLE